MASVTLRRLTKTFARDEKPVLQDLTLEVRDGEFLVLLGPSGCGKTTVLRCIAGLEEPSAGEIRIGEREVTHLAPADRDVAMVFQNHALYPHLTVRANVAFGLEVRRVPKPEIARRVRETAERLGITDLLERRPAELSGGQRQRVALGRAIVRNPQVFLFDEPLSNLDARLRSEMRAELLQLHRGLGATMIYVTHDQAEAMTMGQRIAVLHEGRLRQLGTPAEIYGMPADAFVARFTGNPGMN
ncbi:MAG TPA: ABC transporter ATP-binding protein, partial [Gemmatimonadales bacterium]